MEILKKGCWALVTIPEESQSKLILEVIIYVQVWNAYLLRCELYKRTLVALKIKNQPESIPTPFGPAIHNDTTAYASVFLLVRRYTTIIHYSWLST